MPGRPQHRLKVLKEREAQGLATKHDRKRIKYLEHSLHERQQLRREIHRTNGFDRDAVEQVGGGLATGMSPDETQLAEMIPHKEVWDRIFVAPKEGGLPVPFVKTFWQEELTERIRGNRRRKKPTRLIIVKGRQFGTTTGTAADFYSEMITQPGVPALAVTYKKGEEAVLPIASTYRTFIETDPAFAAEPPDFYSVKNWQGANGSSIKFHIAGEALGRGPHYRLLHGTEVDFWPDFENTMKGLMQAVADHWTSIVVLETTLGDRPSVGLRHLIQAVRDNRNDQWEIWFQEWWKFPNYRAGHESNTYDWNDRIKEHVAATLTGKEQWLVSLGAPLSAIEWRRKTVLAKCFGNEDTFAQEYPATLDEALEYRGNAYYQAAALRWQNTQLANPLDRVNVWCEEKDWHVAPNRNDMEPHLRVWEHPRTGRKYTLGADVASSENPSAAKSDITILDRETGKVVARWWGRVPSHKFGQAVHAAAMYYGGGDCEVRFDRTGVGVAVMGELERLGTPNVVHGTQNKAGFQFTPNIREAILGNHQRLYDACKTVSPCREQHEQCANFTGETKNAGYCDAVVSWALACYRLTESEDWAGATLSGDEEETEVRSKFPMTLEDLLEAQQSARAAQRGKRQYLYSYT